MPRTLARRLARLTSGNRGDFLCVWYPLRSSIEAAAEKVIASVRDWKGDPGASVQEIDVVAISMGGLVARLLASGRAWSGSSPTFKIRRLFTISTPHRGAALARWIRPDAASAAMREGSQMLRELDLALEQDGARPAELVCYVQRLDWWVGTWNTAPRGHPLRCAPVRGPLGAAFSHFTAHQHPAVLVDLARHLRGEAGSKDATSAV